MKDGYVIDPDDHKLLTFRRHLTDWVMETIVATKCQFHDFCQCAEQFKKNIHARLNGK